MDPLVLSHFLIVALEKNPQVKISAKQEDGTTCRMGRPSGPSPLPTPISPSGSTSGSFSSIRSGGSKESDLKMFCTPGPGVYTIKREYELRISCFKEKEKI